MLFSGNHSWLVMSVLSGLLGLALTCCWLFISVWTLQGTSVVLVPTPQTGAGYLDDVTLASARPGPGVPATWVESCTCPVGYGGQFCEMCLSGYRRETPSLGPYSPCVLCTCNGHSETCDPETGEKALRPLLDLRVLLPLVVAPID